MPRPANKDEELEILKTTIKVMRAQVEHQRQAIQATLIQVEHQRRAIAVLLERQGMSWPRQVREDELEK